MVISSHRRSRASAPSAALVEQLSGGAHDAAGPGVVDELAVVDDDLAVDDRGRDADRFAEEPLGLRDAIDTERSLADIDMRRIEQHHVAERTDLELPAIADAAHRGRYRGQAPNRRLERPTTL